MRRVRCGMHQRETPALACAESVFAGNLRKPALSGLNKARIPTLQEMRGPGRRAVAGVSGASRVEPRNSQYVPCITKVVHWIF